MYKNVVIKSFVKRKRRRTSDVALKMKRRLCQIEEDWLQIRTGTDGNGDVYRRTMYYSLLIPSRASDPDKCSLHSIITAFGATNVCWPVWHLSRICVKINDIYRITRLEFNKTSKRVECCDGCVSDCGSVRSGRALTIFTSGLHREPAHVPPSTEWGTDRSTLSLTIVEGSDLHDCGR